MDPLNGSHSLAMNPRRRPTPAAILHWLIEPSASVVEPELRQQVRLLMAIQLMFISLSVITNILALFGLFNEPGEPVRFGSMVDWISVIIVGILAIGYGLSRTKHYPLAAGIVIITLLSGTFAIVIVNPQQVLFLAYLVLGGLVASLFLSARVTAMIFIVTFIGLLLLTTIEAGSSIPDNSTALFFIFSVGTLVVIATSLRQSYLKQLDWRTQQLVESEARLRELSVRDPLTGLFNRRYLEEAMALEMIRARRKQHPIGIIMVDIDHFKRFNDDHGHAAGDAVLIEVGNLIRTHVRTSDVTCRYGGEEFIIVLPEATPEITIMRAEQIREDTRLLLMKYEGETLGKVTLSMGVAIFPDHGSTFDGILSAVDTALYRAKREGRNRVVMAS